jgi:hypothetical protein
MDDQYVNITSMNDLILKLLDHQEIYGKTYDDKYTLLSICIMTPLYMVRDVYKSHKSSLYIKSK